MTTKRWFKWTLLTVTGVLAFLALALAAGVWWVLATLDTEAGRQRVAYVVGLALDREVRIEGALDVDLSLHPTISIEGLRIANPGWAGDPVFLEVENAQARVAALPFLARTLEVDWFRGNGIRLWLQRRADGTTNWEFGEWLTQKSVRQAKVGNADVIFRTPAGREYRAELSSFEARLSDEVPVELQAGGRFRGVPIEVGLRGGRLADLLEPGKRWSFEGQIDMGESELGIQGALDDPADPEDAEVVVAAGGSGLDVLETLLGRRLPTLYRYAAHARLQARDGLYTVNVSAEANEVGITLARAQAEGRPRVTAQRITARLEASGRDADELVGAADLQLAAEKAVLHADGGDTRLPLEIEIKNATATSAKGGPITLAADILLNESPLDINGTVGPPASFLRGSEPVPIRLTLVSERVRSEFHGVLRPPVTAGALEGNLTLDTDDLTRLGRFAGAEWPSVGPVRISSRVVKLEGSLHATDLTVEVGSSQVQGQLDITPDAQPGMRMVVTRGRLDIADFERTDASVSGPAPTADGPASAGSVIPPLELPTAQVRGLDLDFLFKRLQVVRGEQPVAALEGRFSAAEGRARLDIAGGKKVSAGMDVRLALDTEAVPPRVELRASARGFDYGAVLRNAGFSDKVQGMLDFGVELAGRGTTLRDATESASGSVTFTGGEGLVPRRLLELWGGGVFKALLGVFGGGDQTRLNCAAGRFTVDNGLLETDLLLVDTSEITVAGDLAVNLSTEELQGLFRSRSKQLALLKVGRPVELFGTLGDPQTRFAGSRVVELGKWIIGLSDVRALILLFGELGAEEQNPCKAILERKAERETAPATSP